MLHLSQSVFNWNIELYIIREDQLPHESANVTRGSDHSKPNTPQLNTAEEPTSVGQAGPSDGFEMVKEHDKKVIQWKLSLHQIGFWGGLVPENASSLGRLLNAGVLGLKGLTTSSKFAQVKLEVISEKAKMATFISGAEA